MSDGRDVSSPLDEIEALIDNGELRRARTMLSAARERPGVEQERWAQLDARLVAQAAVAGPAGRFEAARAAEDWVSARRYAAEAAKRAVPEDAAKWARVEAACARNVHAEWRIGELEVDEGLDAAVDFVGEVNGLGVGAWATPDDALILLSGYGRWLFVREVDLAASRLRKVGWLRVPEAFGALRDYQAHGSGIWVFGDGGLGLELSRQPLGVVRSFSVRPFMLPGQALQAALLSPDGRYLWAQVGDDIEDFAVAVIDLETEQVCARPDIWRFRATSGAVPFVVYGSHPRDDGRRLFDAAGQPLQALGEGPNAALEVAAHPNGRGWVTLEPTEDPERPDDPEQDSIGLVAHIEGHPPSDPVVVPHSDPEMLVSVAVSRSARLLFILHCATDGVTRLRAYRPTLGGFREVWQVRAPSTSSLVQDANADHCWLLRAGHEGVGVSPPLSREGPASAPEPQDELRWRLDSVGEARYEEGDFDLLQELDEDRRKKKLRGWTERHRKRARNDPKQLARLARLLTEACYFDEAHHLLDIAAKRHPEAPALKLAEAGLHAAQKSWDLVQTSLAPLLVTDPAEAPTDLIERAWALVGSARLRRGDAAGAHEAFGQAGEATSERGADPEVARILCEPEARGSSPQSARAPALSWHRVIRACRRADARRDEGDAAGARRALEIPAVFGRMELQSAARLADAALVERADSAPTSEDPVDLDEVRRALSMARLLDPDARWPEDIAGLGWPQARLESVAVRAKAYLRDWRAGVPEKVAAVEGPSPSHDGSEPAEAEAHPRASDEAPKTHALPPLGHEAVYARFPGMQACVEATARLVRGLPEWSETMTLGEELVELGPVARYLEVLEREVGPEQIRPLPSYLDQCVNFELHRRKLFFADEALAWMLHETTVDVEGRVLRMPFPCFGLVFTDERTRALAEAAAAGPAVEVVTAYVIEAAASHGRRSLRIVVVLDARDGAWPRTIKKTLTFREEDGLDEILGGVSSTARRELLQLVINGILYSTSAGVPWPISRAPQATARRKAKGRGKAKRAKVQRQVAELTGRYSSEDVFYLPGRIPIRQLRRPTAMKGGEGDEVYARFLVRGHWRRAPARWRGQRLRWIEPYWKGPELAATIEREYRLKL